MVGYWIHKYCKDEDVTTTEYITFEEKGDFILPELNICITNPFLNYKLENISKNLSIETYLKYIKGEISSNKKLDHIDYDKITLNLFEHLNKIVVTFRPGKNTPRYICKNPKSCPYVNLKPNHSGFLEHVFYRCFGFETNRKHSKDISNIAIDFKSTLAQNLRRVANVRSVLNYPYQQFYSMTSHHALWTNINDTKSFSNINIRVIEILSHRNKPNRRCFEDWMYYDDLILKDHIKKVGCRAPYQNIYKHLPACDTEEKMKQSIFNIQTLPNLPVPCQEMSQLAFDFTSEFELPGYDEFPIIIVFPDKIRAITQSQAIDIHSLIGNIGGYIGLFLGKSAKHI